AVLANLINFLLSLAPLLLLLVVLRFPLHATWLYLPVPMLGLAMFSLGCAFFVAAANVFFRDVAHILQIVISAWFYLSPIIYSVDMVPARFRFFFHLNPLVYVLNGFRLSIYYGLLPSAASAAMSIGIGLTVLVLGYAFFRRLEDSFVFYI
ncbi:MAG: ABC transporter permease, partial [Terriglobales bacterium]